MGGVVAGVEASPGALSVEGVGVAGGVVEGELGGDGRRGDDECGLCSSVGAGVIGGCGRRWVFAASTGRGGLCGSGVTAAGFWGVSVGAPV